MKALEIIKKWDNMEFGDSLEQHKRKIDKAIKELEELNNRSCRNCKHSIFIEAIETRWCMLLENSCTILKYCSEFEAKR